uniref:Tyrosine-protein phosphatase domain-containing protein n=1 Tax=Aplanochytrium stocchinoi TaxID=215587 RepID=A0A7S3PQQ5_9STRA|mmetsp:Transcript_594/g.761  ORF Transcript_594/g.761 Transcript_594/m.761 type:complete len:136 (+) Transcript_594:341-748(+)
MEMDANGNISKSKDEEVDEEEEVEYGYLQVAQVSHSRLLIPPLNFSLVNKGVYRSGYPNKRNFAFLETIGIRTFICLATEAPAHLSIANDNLEFIKKRNMKRIEIPVEGIYTCIHIRTYVTVSKNVHQELSYAVS